MNLKQKAYFIKRIDEIAQDKILILRRSMTLVFDTRESRIEAWDDNKISVDMAKLLKLLRKTITQRSHYGVNHWASINVGDFLRGAHAWERKMEAKQKKYDDKKESKCKTVLSFATELKDKCMFGSEAQAFRMMNEFIKKKF